MSKAIKIIIKKAHDNHDLGASKFFGTPTIPLEWQDNFSDDEIFFCQIRLSDIAKLDEENKLPHTGYLYIFLHTGCGIRDFRADVRYYEGEPTLAFDDFNAAVDEYENYTEAYLMEFSEASEDEDCTRLFGIPSAWSQEDHPKKLLLQYDPLDHEMGFLDSLDGYLYFFFGENERDFEKVTLTEEYT